MNINPLIEMAFKDFKVDNKTIPITFMRHIGKSDSYLTYYTWQTSPKSFADDVPHMETVYTTIDIWSRGNFKKIVEEVKKVMARNGFTWTDNGPEDFDRETGFYHVPINFYYAESA